MSSFIIFGKMSNLIYWVGEGGVKMLSGSISNGTLMVKVVFNFVNTKYKMLLLDTLCLFLLTLFHWYLFSIRLSPSQIRRKKDWFHFISLTSLGGLVEYLSYWWSGGCSYNPPGRQHSFVSIDHEIFYTVIFSRWVKKGSCQFPILVNRLED